VNARVDLSLGRKRIPAHHGVAQDIVGYDEVLMVGFRTAQVEKFPPPSAALETGGEGARFDAIVGEPAFSSHTSPTNFRCGQMHASIY
jgi:hypothetical protein